MTLNINDLLIESDWGNARKAMDKCRAKGDWWNYFWVAMPMIVVFHKKRDELGLDEEVFKGMRGAVDSYLEFEEKFKGLGEPKEELDYYRSRGTWHSYCPQAMALKILFPDESKGVVPDTVFENVKDILDWFRKENNWVDFAALSMDIKVLFPKRVKELKFCDRDWDGMKGLLDSYRRDGNWWNFPSLAVKMYTIFPDRRDDLGLDDAAWDGIVKKLVFLRENNKWQEFCVQCFKVKILTSSPTVVKLVIGYDFARKALEKADSILG